MSLQQVGRLIGTGDPEKRVKDDFYATPVNAIEALLRREKFEGSIWEPACGDGAICKTLNLWGYWDVHGSDIVDRGYKPAEVPLNFLNCMTRNTDNIITNPPFNIGTEFTLHSLNCARKKVAIFNKLTFLEGVDRSKRLYSLNMLRTVYVFSRRVSFGAVGKGGMMAFAWFVFDKQYNGKPTLEWI
jgi:hypothetical protein